jgi:hypothetical protein
MLSTFNADKNLENALFGLLERYGLQDVVEILYRYTDLQAELAKTLQQDEAAAKWERQADALDTTCEMLEETDDDDDDDLYYLIY